MRLAWRRSDTVIGRVLGSTRVFIGKDLFDEADIIFTGCGGTPAAGV
jgi:hypothetical protein